MAWREPAFPLDWRRMLKSVKQAKRKEGRSNGAAPTVVFLHGPPASGKLTIAKELCALTGFQLFHNHLVVDLLLSLFPFGSPDFVRQREAIWLELMGSAVASGRSLVFTFAPERTVRPGFPGRLRRAIRRAGGVVRFVGVRCSEAEIESRLGSPSRRSHGKIVSLDLYRELRRTRAFAYSPIDSDLEIDSTSALPRDSADRIARFLSLRGATSFQGTQAR